MVARIAYTSLLLSALAVAVVQPHVPVAGLAAVTAGLFLRVVAVVGRARLRRAAPVPRIA